MSLDPNIKVWFHHCSARGYDVQSLDEFCSKCGAKRTARGIQWAVDVFKERERLVGELHRATKEKPNGASSHRG